MANRRSIALAAFTLSALLQPLSAQVQAPQAPGRLHGISAGLHAGSEYSLEGTVVGAQLQLQLDPWGLVYLMPSAEYEFRRGINDRQGNADAAIRPYRDFYVGGGLAWRNTIFDTDIGRETRQGHSFFLGAFSGSPRPGRLGYQVELRWGRFRVEHPGEEDTTLKPRWLTLGVNYPLLLWR